MFIAWSTVATRNDAERLATETVEHGLASCVQIEGPILSVYRWQGRTESNQEFRLMFKCAAERLPALETFVLAHHPYDTPEWIAVRADAVGEKYLSWARANSTTPPL